MGTDTIQCEAIIDRAESAEPELMLVTPVLWVGNSANHLGFKAALLVDPTRYVTLLVDLGKSFLDQGFRHLLFVNGHGGNSSPLLTALHQLEHDYIRVRDDLQIAGLSWWSVAPEVIAEVRESPPGAAGHACEIETSVMLAARPGLVRMERYSEGAAGHPHADWASYDFNAPNRVALVEMFHRGAPSGVVGSPALATPTKGEAIISRTAARIVEFVRDFSTW